MTKLPMPGSRVRAIGTDSERQVGVVCEEAGETETLKSCGDTFVRVVYPRLDGKRVWSPLRAIEAAT